MLKVNDLFCGCGGIGLGFKEAGFETAGAWDYDKYAVQSYIANVDSIAKQADITQMTYEDMPKADVWTFGFPCQDLSIAGTAEGLRVTCLECETEFVIRKDVRECPSCGGTEYKAANRSGLFFEVMRLLAETRENNADDLPRIILAENVKGLKPYIEVLKEEYQKQGYKFYIQLYNSKYWGVPQNRERYFVVGVREDIAREFIYPVQQTEFVPKLSSILEQRVDEKYYIDDEKAQKIIDKFILGEGEAYSVPLKFLDRNQNVLPEYAMCCDVSQTNGVAIKLQGVFTDKDNCAYCADASYAKGISPASDFKSKRTHIVEVEKVFDIHGIIIDDTYGYDGVRVYTENSPTLRSSRQGLKTVEVEKVFDIPKEIINDNERQRRVYSTKGISPTILGRTDGPKILECTEPHLKQIGMLEMKGNECIRRVYDAEGIAPTATTCEGGHRQIKILVREATKKGYAEATIGDSINIAQPNSKTRRGRVGHQIAQTLLTGCEQVTICPIRYRIRKLTPTEYGWLQGFPMHTWEQVVSNSQAYKQFGNAVTVSVAKAMATAIKYFLE